jgi:hypothetical protein
MIKLLLKILAIPFIIVGFSVGCVGFMFLMIGLGLFGERTFEL